MKGNYAMTQTQILYICLGFVLFSLLFYLFSVVFASYCVYIKTLKRPSKEKWGRDGPSDTSEAHLKMDAIKKEQKLKHIM